MWTYADAIAIALDEARENPGTDTDKLATQLWAEMQAENATFDPNPFGTYCGYCVA